MLESLESRTLLSASLDAGTGLLTVIGTDGADRITVSVNPANAASLAVNTNGCQTNVPRSQVTRIHIEGLGGSDYLGIDESRGQIAIPADIYGGRGNDTLVGGSAANCLYGNRNNDTLFGGTGWNLLDDGLGADKLFGHGTGRRDTLIAGDDGAVDLLNSGGRKANVTMGPHDLVNTGAASRFVPLATPGSPMTPFAATPVGYTPQQVRQAYGLNNNAAVRSLTGAGQTIAIVTAFDAPYIANDFATFNNTLSSASLRLTGTGTFTKVYAAGTQPPMDAAWAGEAALDVQWSHAMAPAANIILVEAASDMPDDMFTAVSVAVSLVQAGGVVSLSWGSNVEGMAYQAYDRVFTRASARNVSFVVASGNTASMVGHPGGCPWVTTVGGTSLPLGGTGQRQGQETAWSEGGGGPSALYLKPGYQRGVAARTATRVTPDVAWNADPDTGVAMYDSTVGDNWIQVGGTSAGTAQWAGLVTLANEMRQNNGLPALGNRLNDVIYRLAGTSQQLLFNDIVGGSNGHPATIGFDMATGWGSPKADLLLPALSAADTTVTTPRSPSAQPALTFHADYTQSLAAPLTGPGVATFAGTGTFSVDQSRGTVGMVWTTVSTSDQIITTANGTTITSGLLEMWGNALRLNADLSIRGYTTAMVITSAGGLDILNMKFLGRAYRVNRHWAIEGKCFAIDPITGAEIKQGINTTLHASFGTK